MDVASMFKVSLIFWGFFWRHYSIFFTRPAIVINQSMSVLNR